MHAQPSTCLQAMLALWGSFMCPLPSAWGYVACFAGGVVVGCAAVSIELRMRCARRWNHAVHEIRALAAFVSVVGGMAYLDFMDTKRRRVHAEGRGDLWSEPWPRKIGTLKNIGRRASSAVSPINKPPRQDLDLSSAGGSSSALG